ncbi:peroxidase-related enzyme [Rhodothermus marinus]|uniref:peroxidase-related enzyme n=1 Tax=Rhodothermus marinus TaxID=29549 RepID=UPI0037C7DF8B
MAWIEIIPEEAATGELKTLYEEIRQRRGKISNILAVHSLHPGALRAHLELYLQVMFSRSGLSRAERELIAVVVSATNHCTYCVQHHAEALKAYWKDPEQVAQAVRDYRELALPERTRALLDHAVKLTRTPEQVTEGDVQRLRALGWTDRDILDLTLIVAYFNFVNRIALGLGVTPTPEEVQGYRY